MSYILSQVADMAIVLRVGPEGCSHAVRIRFLQQFSSQEGVISQPIQGT